MIEVWVSGSLSRQSRVERGIVRIISVSHWAELPA